MPNFTTLNYETFISSSFVLPKKSSFRTLPLIPAVEELLLGAKAKQEQCHVVAGSSDSREYLDYVCVDDLGNTYAHLEYTAKVNSSQTIQNALNSA